METAGQIIKWLQSYPEVLAILLGVGLSGLIVMALDAFYLPESWSYRKCSQWSLAINVILGTGICYSIWRWLDPADGKGITAIVSGSCSAASPAAYWVLSKVVSWKWPTLDLSMGLKGNRK